MLFTANLIVLYKTGCIRWQFSHNCGYWWPGDSAIASCISSCWVNTLRPGQNGRHFADNTFNRIFVNENVRISIKISLKFVPKGPINNIPALVRIMAWRQPGNKPLSEPMMVSLLMHICVTRPQWVKRRAMTSTNDAHDLWHQMTSQFIKHNTWPDDCMLVFLKEMWPS